MNRPVVSPRRTCVCTPIAIRALSAMACLIAVAALIPLGSVPALAAPGAHGPNGEHLDAGPAIASPSGLARLPDGSVNVPKIAQRRMGLRTLVAPRSEAAQTFELPGRVVGDPNASGRVQAVHGGRLEPGPRGLPVVGQPVRQGEVLAYVRHHVDPMALGAQQAQLAELRALRQVAEQRVRRLEGLEGTVPRKDIEAARAEARGLAEREQSIGSSLSSRETLVAPVSGVVVRADLAVGQVVDPRDVLVDVLDPARLLVEATTGDVALPGRIEDASLQGIPGVSLRVKGTARVLRDGVLPVTFTVSAGRAGGTPPLAVGQPVTVVARARDRVPGIVLPAQAVVRSPSNEPVVWIKSGAERFIPQPVQVRPLTADSVVVTQGLSPDNRVVIQGAALIAQIR